MNPMYSQLSTMYVVISFIRNPKDKILSGEIGPTLREDNIKALIKETGWDDKGWIFLVWYKRDRWDHINKIAGIWASSSGTDFFTSWAGLNFSARIPHHETN
jgi:hypothetical protein